MSRISIDLLRLDFQPPECFSEETVQEKMQQIAEGQEIEPIIVRFDGDSYFLQDVFHRVEAARRSGVSYIDAEVSSGTLQGMEDEFDDMVKTLRDHLRKGS